MSNRDIISAAAGASGPATYIEDVFSTYLWTGNGTTQSIINGIDLTGKGGMVWRKQRDAAADHFIADTVRGTYSTLSSNTAAAASGSSYIDFLSDGFQAVNSASSNSSGSSQCSWTFREQPKFFDVVTYTGNGTARTIAHNLGSVPGMMFVKATSGAAQDWNVYHRSLGNTFRLLLNSSAQAFDIGSVCWNATTPTSSVFSLGTNTGVNANGVTYVAYLFAHNAGGFGTAGTDNVISCGSFSPNGSSQDISLGYEPQWILIKRTAGARDWFLVDNMRGWTANSASSNSQFLNPNLAAVESNALVVIPTATGFTIPASSALNNDAHIYMAIRRPMKVPTTGTSVFNTNLETTTTVPQTLTTGFPVDLSLNTIRNLAVGKFFMDRLRGGSTTSYNYLDSTATSAEAAGSGYGVGFDNNTGIVDNNWWNNTGSVWWSFRRAPNFFDIVCYTGTGSNTTQAHNLGVAPELIIVKSRSTSGSNWATYAAPLGAANAVFVNLTISVQSSATSWNSTAPTSSVFSLGTSPNTNSGGATYVAYLFASCPGVSKVGSYTGTGSNQTINCGFTGGARFVLIKNTSGGGDWWVWDTARGMVSGTDPRLFLNNTLAQINNDWVFTTSSGFQLVNTTVNGSGESYIYLAIA